MLSSKFLTFFYNQFLHFDENNLIVLGIFLTIISLKHKFHFLSSSSNVKNKCENHISKLLQSTDISNFFMNKKLPVWRYAKENFFVLSHSSFLKTLSFIVFMSYFFISLCRVFKGVILHRKYYDLIFVMVFEFKIIKHLNKMSF